MRKLSIVCFLISILAAGYDPAQAQKSWSVNAEPLPMPKVVSADRDFDEPLHRKCLYPTIRITSVDLTQRSSGVIVRSEKFRDDYHNVVLTCAHCVANDEATYNVDVALYEKDGTTFEKFVSYTAYIYAASPKLDLAVLLFKSRRPMPVAKMDFDRKLCIGNRVMHIGCGSGEDPRMDEGMITSLKGKVSGHPTDVYRTNMHTIFGDSGGPAFYKHKVIGLMQAIRVTRFQGFPTMLPNISMCIPIGTIKTWDAGENNTLRFIYNPQVKMPRLPYRVLDFAVIDWSQIEHDDEEEE